MQGEAFISEALPVFQQIEEDRNAKEAHFARQSYEKQCLEEVDRVVEAAKHARVALSKAPPASSIEEAYRAARDDEEARR